ncbi:MAG: hypothetical protein ACXVED_18475, partial [Bacteroidia bacterium]
VKKIFYILLLTLLSWPVVSPAKKQNSGHSNLFDLIKTADGSRAKTSYPSITAKSGPSQKFDIAKRKKKGKGVRTIRYFISDERPLLSIFTAEELIIFSDTFYTDRLFSDNHKRGPPALQII